ncbi:hypothetical protein LSUE1_G005258, partial [Lachnellula suecica]
PSLRGSIFSMAGLAPLAMSQTKDDLLRHLSMAPETYTMMAKEADRYYKWLTQEKRHLKGNCKGKPPYDWSDIAEKSKEEAMKLIAQSGDTHTSYYWNLGNSSGGSPNWIAKWFLYHKFRYRDGRNRNQPTKGNNEKGSHHHSSRHSGHKHSSGDSYYEPSSSSSPYYSSGSTGSGELSLITLSLLREEVPAKSSAIHDPRIS